jgi:hypothetical protein
MEYNWREGRDGENTTELKRPLTFKVKGLGRNWHIMRCLAIVFGEG